GRIDETLTAERPVPFMGVALHGLNEDKLLDRPGGAKSFMSVDPVKVLAYQLGWGSVVVTAHGIMESSSSSSSASFSTPLNTQPIRIGENEILRPHKPQNPRPECILDGGCFVERRRGRFDV